MGNQDHPSDTAADQRRLLATCWLQTQDAVAAFVWSMVSNQQDVEDIIQDIAESAAASFDRYNPDLPFLPWVMGIARHKLYAYYRECKKNRNVLFTEHIEGIADAYAEIDTEISEVRLALRSCLKKISKNAGKLLAMRYEQDKGPAEIAESLGTTPGYVRVALHRVRLLLHTCIQRSLGEE